MDESKKKLLVRGLTGGCVGAALHAPLGYLLSSFTLFDQVQFTGLRLPDCNFPCGLEPLGVLLSFALWALFGAEVGIATLPFADSGRELVTRSLIHYAVTSATALVWGELNIHGAFWVVFLWLLIPLTLVYVIVWLGRWAAWWSELDAIREKLGLAPVPSPLKWRETMPSLGFALLLCLVVPLALHFFDARDVPLLTALLWPYLLLPVGGFMGGLSLGKRHGVCPLYPAACAVLALTATLLMLRAGNVLSGGIVLAFTRLLGRGAVLNGGIALIAALAGNLSGAARYRRKQRKGGAAHG